MSSACEVAFLHSSNLFNQIATYPRTPHTKKKVSNEMYLMIFSAKLMLRLKCSGDTSSLHALRSLSMYHCARHSLKFS